GYAYSTLLVEPPIFLAKLQSDLQAANVPFIEREFSSANEVLALSEHIIVNCTGLGSRKIWNDHLVTPVKGQLVLLPPQPRLQYLYSGHGYLFPRQDAVVVGGSEERTFRDDKPDLQMCRAILANVRTVFEGQFLAAAAIPGWFIQNK